MLKCIAVDDEPLALNLLAGYIRKVPFLELVAICGDAFEAAEVLQQNEIDLMFIDIQMPGLTGLQFIQSLVKKPMIILVTAYKKFALEGFELDVVDYLIKPMGMDRFLKACYKAQELYQLKTGATGTQANFLFLNVDYSLVKVLFDDIIWIEVAGDYLKVNLKSTTKPLIVRMTAKALDSELPKDKFIRIHKSYIIAVASITSIRKNSIVIRDMELPIGETYRDAVRQIAKRDI